METFRTAHFIAWTKLFLFVNLEINAVKCTLSIDLIIRKEQWILNHRKGDAVKFLNFKTLRHQILNTVTKICLWTYSNSMFQFNFVQFLKYKIFMNKINGWKSVVEE